jgi:hypothetical protein
VIIQYDVQVVHQQEFQSSSAGIVTRVTPRIGETVICNFQFGLRSRIPDAHWQ